MKNFRSILLMILLPALFLVRVQDAAAETVEKPKFAAGLFNSPKGFGLECDSFKPDNHINSYSLFLDLQGILDGSSSSPGFRARYNYNILFCDEEINAGERLLFYAGPGATFGYVRDTNNRIGIMGGVSGNIGCMLLFRSRFSLSFNIETSVAFHLREDTRIGVYDFKFFQAGVVNTYMPEVRISYCW